MRDKTKTDVFSLLKKIPKGKVTTYKILAQKTGIKNPRIVGQIIHQNKEPETFPCYKVVRSDGAIATGYAFGGQRGQIEKLKKDGIVTKNKRIDLRKYLFQF